MNKSKFFKYIANGGRIKMITYHDEPTNKPEKKARTVQSNAIVFDDGSRLYHSDIAAKEVTDIAIGMQWPGVNVGWAVYALIDNPEEVLNKMNISIKQLGIAKKATSIFVKFL
jgi:hypothetical protein